MPFRLVVAEGDQACLVADRGEVKVELEVSSGGVLVVLGQRTIVDHVLGDVLVAPTAE